MTTLVLQDVPSRFNFAQSFVRYQIAWIHGFLVGMVRSSCEAASVPKAYALLPCSSSAYT
jgi:hypothetical protein